MPNIPADLFYNNDDTAAMNPTPALDAQHTIEEHMLIQSAYQGDTASFETRWQRMSTTSPADRWPSLFKSLFSAAVRGMHHDTIQAVVEALFKTEGLHPGQRLSDSHWIEPADLKQAVLTANRSYQSASFSFLLDQAHQALSMEDAKHLMFENARAGQLDALQLLRGQYPDLYASLDLHLTVATHGNQETLDHLLQEAAQTSPQRHEEVLTASFLWALSSGPAGRAEHLSPALLKLPTEVCEKTLFSAFAHTLHNADQSQAGQRMELTLALIQRTGNESLLNQCFNLAMSKGNVHLMDDLFLAGAYHTRPLAEQTAMLLAEGWIRAPFEKTSAIIHWLEAHELPIQGPPAPSALAMNALFKALEAQHPTAIAALLPLHDPHEVQNLIQSIAKDPQASSDLKSSVQTSKKWVDQYNQTLSDSQLEGIGVKVQQRKSGLMDKINPAKWNIWKQ